MDILENLKAKGIIRAHGTSVHSLEAMQKVAETDWVDVLHARINPYGIVMDRKDPQEVVDVMDKIHQQNKGIPLLFKEHLLIHHPYRSIAYKYEIHINFSLSPKSNIMPFTASDICKIILAIILPPLGVFLERGCGADLLINILLTILGYIPGIIHALYIILKY